MNYAANLNAAMIMAGATLFVMSWDLIPVIVNKVRGK